MSRFGSLFLAWAIARPMAAGVTQNKFDLILGIVLIVLGVLILLDWLNIPFLTEIVAVLLIILGIWMLMQKQNAIIAILAIAFGVLILVFSQVAAAVGSILTIIIGVVLLVGGILKLLNKW